MSNASMPIVSFILLTVSEKNFEYFFENLPLCRPVNQNKLSDLNKSRMQHGGLLNKHICENKIQISPVRQQKLSIYTFPIISLWEL